MRQRNRFQRQDAVHKTAMIGNPERRPVPSPNGRPGPLEELQRRLGIGTHGRADNQIDVLLTHQAVEEEHGMASVGRVHHPGASSGCSQIRAL